MKKFLQFIFSTLWLSFQFILAVGITVIVLSVIPVAIILLVGLIGLLFAAQISFMLIVNSPLYGFALAILIFAGVVIATISAIALFILVFMLAVSFIALPVSLIAQAILRHNEIKSWLVHITTYSFSGALIGIIFGSLGALITWISLRESQYAALAMAGILIVFMLSGIVSVNICGITLGTTTKLRDFFVDLLSKKKVRSLTAQSIR